MASLDVSSTQIGTLEDSYQYLCSSIDKSFDKLLCNQDADMNTIDTAFTWLENLSDSVSTWAVDVRVRDSSLLMLEGTAVGHSLHALFVQLAQELMPPQRLLAAFARQKDEGESFKAMSIVEKPSQNPSTNMKLILDLLYQLQDSIEPVRHMLASIHHTGPHNAIDEKIKEICKSLQGDNFVSTPSGELSQSNKPNEKPEVEIYEGDHEPHHSSDTGPISTPPVEVTSEPEHPQRLSQIQKSEAALRKPWLERYMAEVRAMEVSAAHGGFDDKELKRREQRKLSTYVSGTVDTMNQILIYPLNPQIQVEQFLSVRVDKKLDRHLLSKNFVKSGGNLRMEPVEGKVSDSSGIVYDCIGAINAVWRVLGYTSSELDDFIVAHGDFPDGVDVLLADSYKVRNRFGLHSKPESSIALPMFTSKYLRIADKKEKALEGSRERETDRELIERELDERERELDEREKELDEREKELDERERELDEREKELDEREKELDERERELDERERRLDEREREWERVRQANLAKANILRDSGHDSAYQESNG